MCLQRQKWWGEVEVGLAEFKALICKAEANSNGFIHAFIQQTLLEHLLYAKHYSRDGGYCDNTEETFILLELLFMVRESDNKQNTIMYLG